MNKKSTDNIIMERIFDIDDGSYTIKTSIGDLIIEKQTLDTEKEYDYYNKKVFVNIYKNATSLFSKYYYEKREYLGDDMLGGYGNHYEKYAIDYPEYNLFKNVNVFIYGYEKRSDGVVVYLDKDRVCLIKDDVVRIEKNNLTEKCYKITNNLIYDNNFKYIKINIDTGEISIKLNGSFIKFDKDEDIISKINMYSKKIKKLEHYIEKNMNDIKKLIDFDFALKLDDKNLVNENGILDQINDLKNIKNLYNEGMELLYYKHDERIKRQIAEGLNTYSKKRIGIKDEIICDRSTQEGLLLSKLEKLDNGYYIIDSPKGLIEIDINLYKDITISFNNETIFNIEYGTIQYISNSLMDVIEEINKKTDKELAKQNKVRKQNDEIEKQNEIKRLEKRLKELKKD